MGAQNPGNLFPPPTEAAAHGSRAPSASSRQRAPSGPSSRPAAGLTRLGAAHGGQERGRPGRSSQDPTLTVHTGLGRSAEALLEQAACGETEKRRGQLEGRRGVPPRLPSWPPGEFQRNRRSSRLLRPGFSEMGPIILKPERCAPDPATCEASWPSPGARLSPGPGPQLSAEGQAGVITGDSLAAGAAAGPGPPLEASPGPGAHRTHRVPGSKAASSLAPLLPGSGGFQGGNELRGEPGCVGSKPWRPWPQTRDAGEGRERKGGSGGSGDEDGQERPARLGQAQEETRGRGSASVPTQEGAPEAPRCLGGQATPSHASPAAEQAGKGWRSAPCPRLS